MATEPTVFQAYYDEPYNVIVQPNRFLYYFRLRWMRELGPVGTSIVIYLRGLCYYNPEKGEKRDICEAKFEDIGDAIGVSRPTIVRELGPHAKDDAVKGIKKGDPVNPALLKFVAKQSQFNLTDKGVRRAANIYRVRMDDPIHPDDQAHYELLCSQYIARQSQPEQATKPFYKDSRTGTGSPRVGDKKPKAQNDPQANFQTVLQSPAAQIDSQASEGNHTPANQNDSANSLNVLFTNVETFNVTESNIDTKQENRVPSRDVVSDLIEAKVTLLVQAFNDQKSERRYRQLVGICEKHNLLSLIDVALQATETKHKTNPMDRPGGYFQKILLTNLDHRGIHVPSVSEASRGKSGVASAVRDSLNTGRGGGGDVNADSGAPQSRLSGRSAASATGNGSPGNLELEIADLKRTGGPDWESWSIFVNDTRRKYEDGTKDMTPGLRQRSLASFESPERQRSLWRQWQQTNQS